jgi:hypothetical protein
MKDGASISETEIWVAISNDILKIRIGWINCKALTVTYRIGIEDV